MRVVLVGQAAFGQSVLKGLLAAGHEIAAVYALPESKGKKDPLAVEGEQAGLTVRTPASYKTPEVAAEFRALNADLGVLAFVTKIIPPAVFEAPRLGTLCFHPSLLPKYRGVHTHERALAAGETEHGVSIHFVTPELDGGPVFLQATVPVLPGDDADTLAARVLVEEHKLYPLAIRWFAEGRVRLDGDTVLFDGAPLTAPKRLDDGA